MKTSGLIKIVAAGMLAGALATPVLAHGVGGARQDSRGWPDHMMGGGYGMMMDVGRSAMQERIEGRLAFLKTELKITESQSGAWDELAGTIRSTSKAHNKLMRDMIAKVHDEDFAKMALPERLDLMETNMQARLDQMKQVKGALTGLYAVLDNEQREAANEIMLPMMGMGMGMMRQGGRRGMMN